MREELRESKAQLAARRRDVADLERRLEGSEAAARSVERKECDLADVRAEPGAARLYK